MSADPGADWLPGSRLIEGIDRGDSMDITWTREEGPARGEALLEQKERASVPVCMCI